jgi:hypothetical protein
MELFDPENVTRYQRFESDWVLASDYEKLLELHRQMATYVKQLERELKGHQRPFPNWQA